MTALTKTTPKINTWGHLRVANWRVIMALGMTVFFWASAFPAIRVGLEAYSPAHVALLRYLVASTMLAGYAAVIRMPLPALRDVPGIALCGVIGITVYNVALNTGEVSVPAGVASFLIAMAPVFVALLARGFLGERLKLWGWLGIAVSFSGVAVIALGKSDGFALNNRALLILLAAASQGIFIVSQKPYLSRYSAFQFVTYAIWSGTAALLVFLPGLVGSVRQSPAESTLAIVYMGIFPGAIAYVCYAYALARIPVSRGASFIYLVPVLAMLMAWLWLGEVPALISIFGGALVLGGVVMVNVYGRTRR